MRRIGFFGSLVVACLFGLAHTASADLPYGIQVVDSDNDADIDGDDILAAISLCGPQNYFGGGCTIELPRQTISLTSTLVLGAGTAFPAGIILRGQGSCSRATSPPGYSAGTVLRWDGADAGTMVEIQRAYRLRFENLCLVLDPDMTAGGDAARYGFFFAGDPSQGHITQGTVFQNVAIWGPVGTPPPGMTAVYITSVKPGQVPKSAQNDKMDFENVFIRGVDIGIHQDALQALLNVFENGSLFANTTALLVSGGNIDLRDSIVGCDSPDCVVLHLAYQQSAGHQETLFSNLYWESGNERKTFLKIANGFSPTNSNPGNNTPVVIENSYMNNQRIGDSPDCQQLLLDAAMRAPVIFRGNHLFATGDPELSCGFDLQISDNETNDSNILYWTENQARTRAPDEFLRVTLVGPNLDILATAIDPDTGHTFNDKNLNRKRDTGEETFEKSPGSATYGPALWALPGTSGTEACADVGLSCGEATEIEGLATAVGCATSSQKRVVFCW